MVGAQAAQAVLQTLQRVLVVAPAILGHQEDLLAVAIDGEVAAHDLFRSPAAVVPGVVEEGDAFVGGHVHEACAFCVGNAAGVRAADAHQGDAHARAAERPRRHAGCRCAGCLCNQLFSDSGCGHCRGREAEEITAGGVRHRWPSLAPGISLSSLA